MRCSTTAANRSFGGPCDSPYPGLRYPRSLHCLVSIYTPARRCWSACGCDWGFLPQFRLDLLHGHPCSAQLWTRPGPLCPPSTVYRAVGEVLPAQRGCQVFTSGTLMAMVGQNAVQALTPC